MYRVALHLGNLLAHSPAHPPSDLVGTVKKFIPTFLRSRWGPQQPARDEQAGPGVCAELKREEGASETDPLAATSSEDDDEGRWGMDDTWLSLP
jgi:hypothetical protein